MISALVGALLGVSSIRLFWKGLAALLVIAVVLPIVSTSLALQFNHLAEQIDMRPPNLARVTALQFAVLLFWYCVGAGIHWFVSSRKSKIDDDEERAS